MDFTKQELETLAYALHDRESRMLDDMEAYRNQHNREAQMDCRDEYKKAATLNDRVHAELDRIETEEQEKEMIEFVVSRCLQEYRRRGLHFLSDKHRR